jgi:hypothetical protein
LRCRKIDQDFAVAEVTIFGFDKFFIRAVNKHEVSAREWVL